MRIETKQLKAFILDSNLVKEEELENALKEAIEKNVKFEDILVNKNLISKEALSKLKAYILGIPYVNLEKEIVDPEILKIIPEPIARSNNIIAFRKRGRNLEVAMLDPDDLRTIDFIRKTANLKILPRLTDDESIKSVLKQYQKSLENEFKDLIEQKGEEVKITAPEELTAVPGSAEENLTKAAKELPIIRILDTLLKHAILQRSSDIHIEPQEKEVVVRYRIDGVLRDAMVLPKQVQDGIVARIKVLSKLKLDEHRLPQDGRFKIETGDYKYSIRVSVLPIFDGEKVVMRLLSEDNKGFTLEDIGLSGNSLEWVYENIKKPVGMILITGPTGSGKTTTLYSILEILNTPEVNISTIEDPIEYRMPRINQTQVNPKINLTFSAGLRSLVRQDPDIIMVGEIRDNETASLAINAALTGHLVLTTLHTNSAAGAIPRLLDMEVEPFLLSSTLNIIVAQRLVRRLSEEKIPCKLNQSQIKNLGNYCNLKNLENIFRDEKIIKPEEGIENATFYKPKSGEDYSEGYRGRIGIFEVLRVSEVIKEMVVKNATSDNIQDQAQKEGMTLMIEDGLVKAARGFTTIEEVLRVITE
jgi:type IV pilus assembly protein PilB